MRRKYVEWWTGEDVASCVHTLHETWDPQSKVKVVFEEELVPFQQHQKRSGRVCRLLHVVFRLLQVFIQSWTISEVPESCAVTPQSDGSFQSMCTWSFHISLLRGAIWCTNHYENQGLRTFLGSWTGKAWGMWFPKEASEECGLLWILLWDVTSWP
jgi:hypothetical protein